MTKPPCSYILGGFCQEVAPCTVSISWAAIFHQRKQVGQCLGCPVFCGAESDPEIFDVYTMTI